MAVAEVTQAEFSLALLSSDCEVSCVVECSSSDGRALLRLHSDQGGEITASGHDFEEALEQLRSSLEERDLMLLCNRFRQDAFVTSLSRQMSNGLSCYLVQPRTALGPEKLVDCLGPADQSGVVKRSEADEYVAEWKAWFEKPAAIRWIGRFSDRGS